MKHSLLFKQKNFLYSYSAILLEFLDFALYPLMAVVISQVFFSQENPQFALLKTFLLFSASFLIRPLGSLYFGKLLPKLGGLRVIKITLTTMGVATFLLGLLPSVHAIGLWAPLLLLLLRLLQGFSAGGITPGAMAVIHHNADKFNSNFFPTAIPSASLLGILMASAVVFLLYQIFPEHVILVWAWRLPFVLLGFLLCFLSFLPIASQEAFDNKKDEKKIIISKVIVRRFLICFFVNAFQGSAFYLLFIWFPSYLVTAQKFDTLLVSRMNTVFMLLYIVLLLLFSLKIKLDNTRRFLQIGLLLNAILLYPLWYFMTMGITFMVYFVEFLMLMVVSIPGASSIGYLLQLFKKEESAFFVGFAYNLSNALIIGFAPTLATFLLWYFHSALGAVFLLIVLSLLAYGINYKNRFYQHNE